MLADAILILKKFSSIWTKTYRETILVTGKNRVPSNCPSVGERHAMAYDTILCNHQRNEDDLCAVMKLQLLQIYRKQVEEEYIWYSTTSV